MDKLIWNVGFETRTSAFEKYPLPGTPNGTSHNQAAVMQDDVTNLM